MPTFDLIPIFGCEAYYFNENPKGQKFHRRGVRAIFFGIPKGTKGYLLYCLENQKLVIRRHVKFIETFLNRRGYEIRGTLTEEIWKRMNEGKDLKE